MNVIDCGVSRVIKLFDVYFFDWFPTGSPWRKLGRFVTKMNLSGVLFWQWCFLNVGWFYSRAMCSNLMFGSVVDVLTSDSDLVDKILQRRSSHWSWTISGSKMLQQHAAVPSIVFQTDGMCFLIFGCFLGLILKTVVLNYASILVRFPFLVSCCSRGDHRVFLQDRLAEAAQASFCYCVGIWDYLWVVAFFSHLVSYCRCATSTKACLAPKLDYTGVAMLKTNVV